MRPKSYDFSGWATVANRRCSDGRTILPGAFKDDDHKTVPLVWNHSHDDPGNVLGNAVLEHRDKGMYTYCTFNDTPQGQNAKEAVRHHDVTSLSIYANQLLERGHEVYHGIIREVSLVLAGANPEAYIDDVLIHSDGTSERTDQAIIYFGEDLELSHADKKVVPIDAVKSGRVIENDDEEEEDEDMKSTDTKKPRVDDDDDETVADVFNTLTEKQKTVVYALIGQALEDANGGDEDDDEEEGKRVKHNVFDSDTYGSGGGVISHSDMKVLLSDAKAMGSLKQAVERHMESGVLAHVDTSGMDIPTGDRPTYGIHGVDFLFPEARTLNAEPDWVSRDMGWVRKVLDGVHHSPFSRVKSVFADITEDDARAKGYLKGRLKKDQVFSLLKRSTTPQTVYKRQKIDRDDVVDITDFDVVAWIKREMRMMLDEEIATAILIGDGRLGSSDDKISEDHIRPIATDAPLFNTIVKVTVANNADDNMVAKAIINAAIRGRKNYKGSGTPSFYTVEDYLTSMLLLEDGIGHKIYRTEAELATTLRTRELVTVEAMAGRTITVDDAELPIIGIITNLVDYNVGADKGGEINLFDDFDIDYNQQKYLIETRVSGALIKPFSALTLVLDRQAASGTGTGD